MDRSLPVASVGSPRFSPGDDPVLTEGHRSPLESSCSQLADEVEMAALPSPLADMLQATGQGHLVEYAATLTDETERAAFVQQLESVDWGQVQRLLTHLTASAPGLSPGWEQRVQPPEALVRQPETPAEEVEWRGARQAGEVLLAAGRVAAIVVAGGQGTRLGFDSPKGLFPIGPVTQKSLFQGFFEQLQRLRSRYGTTVPYAVMTSDATHAATLAFLAEHHWFGLDAADVTVFRQGNMPAVDAETGRALLAGPGALACSPDGHGGMLAGLQRAGLLERWQARGIDTIFYHQVDNPATRLADPALLGWHHLHQAEVTTKVVAKRDASEKMGVAVTIDGTTRIIEYSDLPMAVADTQDERGRLRIWAGNTAIHVFDRAFLAAAASDDQALPFHRARKVVPFYEPERGFFTPSVANAIKFERFIFDVLPWARRSLIVQGARGTEFLPVKNRDGADSPASVRRDLQRMYREWVRAAGGQIGDDVPIEIGPRVAMEADDLRGRFAAGTVFTDAVVWNSLRK